MKRPVARQPGDAVELPPFRAGDPRGLGPAPVFAVPQLPGIVVDGGADDWGDAGFQVEVLPSPPGWMRPVAEFDGRLALGWDTHGLLVFVRVRGQGWAEGETLDDLFAGDSVELFLAERRGGRQLVQAVVAPGVTGAQPELRHRLYDYRTDAARRATPPTLQAARALVPGGYDLEVRLPWASLGVVPAPDTEVAFQLYIHHRAPGHRRFTAVWYPATGTFQDSTRMHRLRLAARPSPPVTMTARAFSHGRDLWFSVVATPELVGHAGGHGVTPRL